MHLGSVLGIWAHPDDETYLSAGVMMRAIEHGHRVVCVTATRGEQGSTDPQRWPPGESLAGVRTQESDRAMAIFGVTEHHWLDYADGRVADVPTDEAVDRILALVGDFRPDLILTFPPSGLTGHPDHQRVSLWAGLVRDQLATGQLLNAVEVRSRLELFGDQFAELGVYMNGVQPVPVPDEEAITLDLTPAELERKVQALLVQPSQTQMLLDAIGHDRMRRFIDRETFLPAQS